VGLFISSLNTESVFQAAEWFWGESGERENLNGAIYFEFQDLHGAIISSFISTFARTPFFYCPPPCPSLPDLSTSVCSSGSGEGSGGVQGRTGVRSSGKEGSFSLQGSSSFAFHAIT